MNGTPGTNGQNGATGPKGTAGANGLPGFKGARGLLRMLEVYYNPFFHLFSFVATNYFTVVFLVVQLVSLDLRE